MKNFIKYISLACASVFALSACNDDEDIITLDPSTFVAPKLENPTSNSLILLEENATETAMTFKWSAAEYGANTPPKYELQIDVKGGNFEKPKVITSTSSVTANVTVKELNTTAIDLGLEPFKEGELEYRVISTVGTPGSQPLISNVNSLRVTPYPTDLSTNWGVVGSITGWADGKDIPFWKTEISNVYVAYIDVNDANSEIKFRQDGKWDVNYGDDGGDGKLDQGGANIKIADVGSYKVTFDLTNLTYKIEPYTWGLVGDATPNGWGGPDVKLAYDGMEDAWSTIVTMKDGEFKFRLNNEWEVSYGGTDTPNVLTDENGANIKIKAGTYKVTANFNKKTYSVEAQ
ncbi:SusE domain-containing protein [Empedobacter brevis]